MLDLYSLQVFLVAAETENFSETGRVLKISQPAVSGHIHALETRLHARLFERTGRNIKLNEVGEALVPLVRNLLKEARAVEEFAALQQGHVAGQLTIGCSTASGKYILPRIMSRFMDQYPDVKIVCEIGPRIQCLENLSQGKIDLAVSSLRVPQRIIEYCHFSDDLLVLVVPPAHPWQNGIVLEQLTEYPIIFREPNSGTVITLNRELAAHDMSVEMLQSHLVIGNTEAIVHAVVAGVGPAFVSRISAQWALDRELVVEVPVPGLRLVQRLYMARHTGFRATDAQTAFWNFTFAPENRELCQFFA